MVNVGMSDRFVRFLIGLAFLMNIAALDLPKFPIIALCTVGFYLVYTAVTGYSVIYGLFKISSLD